MTVCWVRCSHNLINNNCSGTLFLQYLLASLPQNNVSNKNVKYFQLFIQASANSASVSYLKSPCKWCPPQYSRRSRSPRGSSGSRGETCPGTFHTEPTASVSGLIIHVAISWITIRPFAWFHFISYNCKISKNLLHYSYIKLPTTPNKRLHILSFKLLKFVIFATNR